MQLRFIVSGAIIIICAVWIIFNPRANKSDQDTKHSGDPNTSIAKPYQRTSHATKTRYTKLTPDLRRIVYNLEKKQRVWEKTRSPHDTLHSTWNDWVDYSREQIAKLSTEDIAALAAWYYQDEGYDIYEFGEYRQALFYTWALRDYPSARKFLIDLAEHSGLLEAKVNTWRNPWLDEVGGTFNQVLIGYSSNNPEQAWKDYLKDESTPQLKYLMSPTVTIPEIFKNYTRISPKASWNTILETGSEEHVNRMLEGFTDGAPDGLNWDDCYEDFQKSMKNRGINPDSYSCHDIAERWLMEDPIPALNWYADQFINDKNFSLLRGTLGTDDPNRVITRQQLKTDLLHRVTIGHKARQAYAIQAIKALIKSGETVTATAAIELLINYDITPQSLPFLQLIPSIPDVTTSEKLLLSAANSLKTPSRDDPFISSTDYDGFHLCIETFRKVTKATHIPASSKEKIMATLRLTEKQAIKEQMKSTKKDALFE